MGTEWASFFYLYGVGGFVFVGSLILARKRGALDLETRDGRKVLRYLILGYAAYIAFHALTQFVLPAWGGP
ncbi:MAG: hypothetical protein HUU16_02995 [Candidatus Omnitrophica bacterium]|nr:hypothetical protein [Candidatus Omnitrophota bacterium]